MHVEHTYSPKFGSVVPIIQHHTHFLCPVQWTKCSCWDTNLISLVWESWSPTQGDSTWDELSLGNSDKWIEKVLQGIPGATPVAAAGSRPCSYFRACKKQPGMPSLFPFASFRRAEDKTSTDSFLPLVVFPFSLGYRQAKTWIAQILITDLSTCQTIPELVRNQKTLKSCFRH